MTWQERMLLRIDQRGIDDCWPWKSSLCGSGYGTFSRREGGKTITVMVHRVVYEMVYGPPGKLHVLHRCDNMRCANPLHLFLGTNMDNVQDKMQKGRQLRGEAMSALVRGELNGNVLLTEESVSEIRMRIDHGEHPATIASDYGVSVSTVWAIKHRRLWKHVA